MDPATMLEESNNLSSSTAQPARWKALAAGAGIVVVVTIGFFLLFFNRYVGVVGINGSAGPLILSGGLPYRDWFSPTPPLFQLENALWTWLFGTAVIVLRIVGIVERAALGVVLYLWLARLFRISSATLGAIVAVVISAGDLTEPISSYNHDTLFWAIIAGCLASICIDWKSYKSGSLAALFCGASAGLCFCDKQTIGLAITVGIPILVLASLWKGKGVRIASRFAACFSIGWAVPISAISFWLYSHGVLALCLRQIFLKGPSAKAGAPTDFLLRWLAVTIIQQPLRTGLIVAGVLLILTLRPLFRPVRTQSASERNPRALMLIAALSIASICAGAIAAYAGLAPWEAVVKASIYYVLIGCGILAAAFSLRFLFSELNDLEQQFWLLASVGFACALMLSLSWPAFEAMLIPGLGFIVAAFLDHPSKRARIGCYLVSAALLFSLVVFKLSRPFQFGDWSEPSVMAANDTSSLPELWGFRLPKAEVTMLDGATAIIREHSTPEDTIFTYPSMPIFYDLSHRGWPTYAGGHEMDACPDSVASADAARVLKARPAVIIYYRETPDELGALEALWRHGKRSGQRDIIASVETLIKHYTLAASYPAPPTNLVVDVYVRK
jgi:hypothetical protein